MRSRLFSVASIALALVACGGGGGGGGGTNSTPATNQVPSCPTGYSSVVLERTSLPNTTISLSAANATFSFKAPTTNIQNLPSIKICFGVASSPLTENSLVTLSSTYEIKFYDLTNDPLYPATLLHYLDRQLDISFDTSAAPGGTSVVDLVNKTHVFNSSATPLAETVQGTISISTPPQMSSIAAYPSDEGRYVVAYKP